MTKEVAIFLCDRTGNMAKPWAEAGYTCYCVDIKHQVRKERVEGNIIYTHGDIRSWVPPPNVRIIFVAAFPPCTHVAVSGSTDWKKKGSFALIDSLHLFNSCIQVASWSQAPYCVENPKGLLSHYERKADHFFHPADYAGYLPKKQRDGDAYMKETFLWVGNGFKMPKKKPVSPVDSIFPLRKKKSPILKLHQSDDRADIRAITPLGFAYAVFEANCPR